MKFTPVLVLSVLVTVLFGSFVKNIKIHSKPDLISPLVAGVNVSINQAEGSKKVSIFGWQVFTNNYYGYKIKHPSDVNIKNLKNGDVSFQKAKTVNISITQDILSEKDTVNTIMETAITEKSNQLKDKFALLNSISPIAMSSVTAQTFTSKENGENITYYYIPQNDRKYLLITNYSTQNGSADFVISEDIIYSLEFIP